jgi:hypothetical protein
MRSASWKIATNTNVLAGVDYATLVLLAQIYESQQEAIKSSANVLVQQVFDRQTYELQSNPQTFRLFHSLFEEIYGQESLLLELYAEVLEKLPSE